MPHMDTPSDFCTVGALEVEEGHGNTIVKQESLSVCLQNSRAAVSEVQKFWWTCMGLVVTAGIKPCGKEC